MLAKPLIAGPDHSQGSFSPGHQPEGASRLQALPLPPSSGSLSLALLCPGLAEEGREAPTDVLFPLAGIEPSLIACDGQ